MRYFLVLILLVAGCASIPQYYYDYDGVNVKRSDGLYGDWKTSNHSNEFTSCNPPRSVRFPQSILYDKLESTSYSCKL